MPRFGVNQRSKTRLNGKSPYICKTSKTNQQPKKKKILKRLYVPKLRFGITKFWCAEGQFRAKSFRKF